MAKNILRRHHRIWAVFRKTKNRKRKLVLNLDSINSADDNDADETSDEELLEEEEEIFTTIVKVHHKRKKRRKKRRTLKTVAQRKFDDFFEYQDQEEYSYENSGHYHNHDYRAVHPKITKKY